jgi:hypothetical protein
MGHVGLLTVLGAVLLAQCHTAPAPPVVSVVPSTPPSVVVDPRCQDACDNLRALGCDEANPIDIGTHCRADGDCMDLVGLHDPFQTCSMLGTCMVSCAMFCTAMQRDGLGADPSCVARVESCDQVMQCPPTAHSCNGTTCQGVQP